MTDDYEMDHRYAGLLVVAMVLRAIQDVCTDNAFADDARDFLNSDGWAILLNVGPDTVERIRAYESSRETSSPIPRAPEGWWFETGSESVQTRATCPREKDFREWLVSL